MMQPTPPPNESATAILGDNFPRHIFLFGKLHNNSCLCLFVMRCCVGACHLSTHTTRKLSPAHSFLLAEDFSDGPPKRGLAGRACSRCLCWVEPKLGLQPPPPRVCKNLEGMYDDSFPGEGEGAGSTHLPTWDDNIKYHNAFQSIFPCGSVPVPVVDNLSH